MFKNFTRVSAWTVALCVAGTAYAGDSYVVGLSAAMTGPGADTYAPVAEGLRLRINAINAAGGVNGRKIDLQVADDQGEPSKAAANVKRFLSTDDMLLVMNASMSSTYAPMVADTAKTGMPLFFAGSVCPREVYPPAKAVQFCSTSFGAIYDTKFALNFIKETSTEPVKLGLIAMGIPVSRGEIDAAEAMAPGMGLQTVIKEVIPPPTPDYSPFAAKIKESGANWAYAWGPWSMEVRSLEALRKLGWKGKFIACSLASSEEDLARIKDDDFYVFGTNAYFLEGVTMHKQIQAAAAAAKSTFAPSVLTDGWVAGMVLEEALKKTGWPADPKKVTAAMTKLKVDMQGLRGNALEWTEDNHYRTNTAYRVYRWNSAKNAVERVKDWSPMTVQ